MNLPNIPFELILIVLFFVLPALGNLRRRGRGTQPTDATKRERRPPPGSGRTPNGAPRDQTQASTRTSTSTTTTTQTQPPTGTPRWLEEAQRRVREAQGEEPGRRSARGTDPGKAQQPRTTGKPLFESAPKRAQPAARPVQVRPAGSLERPVEIRSLETPRPAGNVKQAAKTVSPLRVQRLSGNKRVTLEPDKLRFDASTVMNGVAWHQVLSPPLSKRRTRLSQRRP